MAAKRTILQERYDLRDILGRSAIGVVYRAFDRLMNREVAIKIILDIDNPETLSLFFKEWSTLAAIVHPNVVHLLDMGEFEQDGMKNPFFVTPLLSGVTLDRLIKEGSPRQSATGVIEIVEQAAKGLHAAHEMGLVHRDVKPSNIFVMADGSVKIIDFCVVRPAKTTLKGTLDYLAPEQLEMKSPTQLSDLYALGVVAYEALTGRRPFQGASEGEVIEAIKHHSPPPVSELNHEVPLTVSQVVDKTIAKQPGQRFYNMREFGDALATACAKEPQPVASPPAAPPSRKGLFIGLSAAAVVVLALAGAVAYSRLHRDATTEKTSPPPSPPATKAKVNIRSTPAGADLRVNGTPCGNSTCALDLAPGDYRVEADLAGYEPANSNFHIGADAAAPPDVVLTLRTTPPLVAVNTDLTDGSILLDGTPAGQLQGGRFDIAKLDPGKHTLFVEKGGFRAAVSLEISAGAAPKMSAPMQTRGMRGFVVIGAGGVTRLYASVDGTKATLDGNPAGIVTPDGLEVKNLAAGSHELLLEAPTGQQNRISFDAGPSTTVTASLLTDQNLGILAISTNEDQADVYVNGEKYRRPTQGGRLMLYLAPRKYSVRVQKTGFATPLEQVVDLKSGSENKLDFQLVVQKPALAIQGKTQELDGTLQGQGTLKIEINPSTADVHLKLKRDGDAQDRDITDRTLNLPEGNYTVTASAVRFQSASTMVKLIANRTATASLSLRPADTASTPPRDVAAVVFTLDDWKKSGWTTDGYMVTHQGGDFLLAPPEFTQASIQFTVTLLKGKRVEWVLGYQDAKNYLLCQLDEHDFNRVQISNGKHSFNAKVPNQMKRDDPVSISISVVNRAVVHRILRGQQWTVLDGWEVQGGVPNGKFGFHVPGRDRIGLMDFRWMAK